MFGPVIEGARVQLEPPRPEWSPTYQRWLADMEVTRSQRNPPSMHQEEELLEKAAEDPNRVVWGIVLKDGDKLIGFIGLDKIDWRRAWEATCSAP